MLRTRRFASVLALVVPLGVAAVPGAAHAAVEAKAPAALKEPPGGKTVTRVQNGGMLTRESAGGKESFEYHFEVWQVRGGVAPGSLESELTVAMQVPLSGPASLGEESGSLKEGLRLPFDLSVGKGEARLYLKDGEQVWMQIKARTSYGIYDHNVHLFDIEDKSAAKPAPNKPAEDKPAAKPAPDKPAPDKPASDKSASDKPAPGAGGKAPEAPKTPEGADKTARTEDKAVTDAQAKTGS